MSASQADPDQTPIRVVETTVPILEWDRWRASADAASRRAHRVAVAVAVPLAVLLAAAGLLLLPGGGRISIVAYAPIAGLASWAGLRAVIARRGASRAVAHARGAVVPALLDDIDTSSLITLLRQGGTLVTARSTVIAAERQDSLVALIASEYDMSKFPAATFPSGPPTATG